MSSFRRNIGFLVNKTQYLNDRIDETQKRRLIEQ